MVGLADTDSYVKWGASLLGSVTDAADATMLVVETPLCGGTRVTATIPLLSS